MKMVAGVILDLDWSFKKQSTNVSDDTLRLLEDPQTAALFLGDIVAYRQGTPLLSVCSGLASRLTNDYMTQFPVGRDLPLIARFFSVSRHAKLTIHGFLPAIYMNPIEETNSMLVSIDGPIATVRDIAQRIGCGSTACQLGENHYIWNPVLVLPPAPGE